jgi:endonuclease/exonuclease/phosphatase family metal-dependent hydrolase
MNKILKFSLIVILIALTPVVVLLILLTITDFQPVLSSNAEISGSSKSPAPTSLTIFNWNIGYGGLGEDMDFFMDGGTGIRAPQEEYSRYMKGIMDTIAGNSAQLYLFQEIDRKSTRSYKEDQYLDISQLLVDYNSTFAPNYKVHFIPSPRLLGTQYGSVHSGLAIFSQYFIQNSTRVSLPGNYSWPRRIFFLDRCMIISEIQCENDKTLYLINTHNSAYDKGSFLKKEQLNFIKEYAMKLYEENKYVIIGGDWNSYMPGTDENSFESLEDAPVFYKPLPDDWTIDNWKWAVDVSIPTNRSLKEAYKKGETFTSIIDGFLLSPNIVIKEVKTLDLGFRHSDHNPVRIEIELE